MSKENCLQNGIAVFTERAIYEDVPIKIWIDQYDY